MVNARSNNRGESKEGTLKKASTSFGSSSISGAVAHLYFCKPSKFPEGGTIPSTAIQCQGRRGVRQRPNTK